MLTSWQMELRTVGRIVMDTFSSIKPSFSGVHGLCQCVKEMQSSGLSDWHRAHMQVFYETQTQAVGFMLNSG